VTRTGGSNGKTQALRLDTILLPVDFSPQSAAAAVLVRTLAQRSGSRITLLHALNIPRNPPLTSQLPDVFPDRRGAASTELGAFAARELGGLDCRIEVATGDPAAAIVELARRERVDLIVMPTHGLGAYRRFLLGSTTAKVLHDAECPVLTGVHLSGGGAGAAAGFGDIETVVCAVDLKAQAERVMEWAAGVAGRLKARLAVIHAIGKPGAGTRSEPGWEAELLSNAQAELETMCSRISPGTTVVAMAGDPTAAVVAQAIELNAGLVVIGRGATGGLFGRLRGKAYDLIREAPCPVASV
jgi:nucleotide-binding universal stress UspA family protein